MNNRNIIQTTKNADNNAKKTISWFMHGQKYRFSGVEHYRV